jgi:hypothetical protein
MYTRCEATTTKQTNMQQPLLNNGSANKLVSTATKKYKKGGSFSRQPVPRYSNQNQVVISSSVGGVESVGE